MSDIDSNCSQNEGMSPDDQGDIVQITPELEKKLYEEAKEYFYLKKKHKENIEDEDVKKKEVNIYINIVNDTVNRYILLINYGIPNGKNMLITNTKEILLMKK